MTLRVVLTVDCERFLSFKQGNPRWNRFEKLKGQINNLIKNVRYNVRGFEVIYNTLIREKFPSTFMITGSLFKPLKSPNFIEWGWHTQNHLPLTLIKDEQVKREVENKYKLKSFTAPMWMIRDITNPSRIFKILKKEGYTHCVYRGKNDGVNHFHYNCVKKPFKKDGIICVHVSGFLEGNMHKEEVNKLKRSILNYLTVDGVYLITTHDFTHKNNRNLLEIVRFLHKLKKQGKIKILRLQDIK